MNSYTCYMKLKDPSPKYGAHERQIKVYSLNIHCAKREVQFEYPDYNVLKVKRDKSEN